MRIKIFSIGKTNTTYVKTGIDEYLGRLKHYANVEWVEIPDVKGGGKLDQRQLKEKEALLLLARIDSADYVVLLDEKGRSMTSVQLSEFLQKRMMDGGRDLIFLIGGAYGFAEVVYDRADLKLSLSPMTFSHQMVRLFFAEQVYRALTILRGEKYHHQ